MKKYFLSILVVMVVSYASFGQTTKTKLDPVKADPKTTENAAKADVQQVNKKNVVDPAALKNVSVKRREHNAKRRKTVPRR